MKLGRKPCAYTNRFGKPTFAFYSPGMETNPQLQDVRLFAIALFAFVQAFEQDAVMASVGGGALA